jgi:uridine monophosphate synthetase
VRELVKDELLEAVWKAGLILLGDRVQEEYGLHTPIFIDLRHKLYDDVHLLARMGRALHQKISEISGPAPARHQQVLGIPDTATPLALAAAMASLHSGVPLLYSQLRKRPAAYPGGHWGVSAFMGTFRPDREVTLIDDVMASGRSKLWAIEQLAKDGITVARILVVVDREQGGDEVLAGRGYPVYSLYTITAMLEYFVATGKVDPQAARAALDYLKAKQFR